MMNRYRAHHASLRPVGKDLAFNTSYSPDLVADFKRRVPADSRKWDPIRKLWLVAAQYGQVCAELAWEHLAIQIHVPTIAAIPTVETRLLKLEYLGRTKDRGNGEASAFGWSDGGWSLIFPESVLREWFDAVPQSPGEKPNLYSVLMLKTAATQDEVRSAYRRLARQWHPDVCHEPNAAEQFKVVQHAYQILFDTLNRRKYDAALAMEQAARAQVPTRADAILGSQFRVTYDALDQQNGYRAPLRCGWVLAEGVETLGRFVLSAILDWQDVTDEQGQTMVVSWPAGADSFEVAWA